MKLSEAMTGELYVHYRSYPTRYLGYSRDALAPLTGLSVTLGVGVGVYYLINASARFEAALVFGGGATAAHADGAAIKQYRLRDLLSVFKGFL